MIKIKKRERSQEEEAGEAEAVKEFWARKEQVFKLSSATAQLQFVSVGGIMSVYKAICTYIYRRLVCISLSLSCSYVWRECLLQAPQAAALFILYFLQDKSEKKGFERVAVSKNTACIFKRIRSRFSCTIYYLFSKI